MRKIQLNEQDIRRQVIELRKAKSRLIEVDCYGPQGWFKRWEDPRRDMNIILNMAKAIQ